MGIDERKLFVRAADIIFLPCGRLCLPSRNVSLSSPYGDETEKDDGILTNVNATKAMTKDL